MIRPSLNFDIDLYINRVVPRSRLHLLPKPISWILGYRETPSQQIGNVLVWFWGFIGAFVGILVIEAVFHTQTLQSYGTPIVIASFGAAAILEYQTIESPLAQPRNAILGQTIAAIIGVSITKLFQLNSNFEELRWIAGALAVGVTSAAMGVTKTIHPPAGATALLAATTPDITDLGWFLIALVLLASVLMVGVACVINNIQRQFPIYWWTPADLSHPKTGDIEETGDQKEQDLDSRRSSTLEAESQGKASIVIDRTRILVPEWISLGPEEKIMLDILRMKLEGGEERSLSTATADTD